MKSFKVLIVLTAFSIQALSSAASFSIKNVRIISTSMYGLYVADDTGRVNTGRTCAHYGGTFFCTDKFVGGVAYWLEPSEKVGQHQLDDAVGAIVDLVGEVSESSGSYFGYDQANLKVKKLVVHGDE